MPYELSKYKLSMLVVLLLSISTSGAKSAVELTRDSYQQSQPEVFGPGIISTGDMELNAAFTPDPHSLYFSKRTPNYQLSTSLVSSRTRTEHRRETAPSTLDRPRERIQATYGY